MGGLFGSPKTEQKVNQTTRRTPWGAASPGLQAVTQQATALAQDPNRFVEQYSPQTEQNLQAAEAFATSPTAMTQYFQPVAAGGAQDYTAGAEGLRQTAQMDPAANPYLNEIIRQQNENLANTINAQFSAGGRYGSGAHTGALTRGLGDLEGRMRYQDYANQQQRIDAARDALYGGGAQIAAQSGRLDEADLAKLSLGQKVGQQRDIMGNQQRLAPLKATEWGMGALLPAAQSFGTSNTRGTTTTSQQIPIGNQILGGMMSLGSMFGGGGFGSLLGGFR